MHYKKLNILLLESSTEDAELALFELNRAGLENDYLIVNNLKDFKEKLFDFLPHVVISDYYLPTCTALDAYELLGDINIPFIIMSGDVGEEKAVEALKSGVADYVSKAHMSRLPLVIERALNEMKAGRHRKSVEHELVQSKERLELALEGTNLGVWDLDFMSNTIVYNKRSLSILGLPQEDAIKEFAYFQGDGVAARDHLKREMQDHIEGKTPMFDQEYPIKKSESGDRKWVLVRGKVIRRAPDGTPLRASGTLLDVTEKKENEEKLAKNKAILENAEAVAQIGSFEWQPLSSRFIYSDGFAEIFEIEKGDYRQSIETLYREKMHTQDQPYFNEILFGGREFYDIEHRVTLTNNETRILRNSGNIKHDEEGKIISIMGIVQDITEQREISKSIFNAQQYERSRMARDIHDGIGQILVGTKFKISSLEADVSAEEFEHKKEEIEDLLASTLEEVRRVSRNMSNRHLEEFGLRKTMEYLVEQVSDAGDFEVSSSIDIPDDYNMDLSSAIYRIAQEATSNIVKYAKASNVSIKVESTNQNIILEVTDDGVGFDTENNWNGIKNMKERTSLQNGHFEISSTVGKGTVIKSWFPLNT
ncbi:PAS domain S-box protein [Gilvimarinus agarilyticus]|uniref:histidine kinase n=1 Tax=Reichenbachiella agariperforans TaxID=156994 RepID=A0A1M6W995_REIAG|nr:PAS domain S-box protein [Reichenbachiella agariperforans]MBU2888047.1 PAS domain S-box protein [Gilvimarinus agarilyticus]MBU2915143.1 PAS domain S-box protein [Reichenbachiella agariperforans]SHK90267.1 PAS domain S-box-containing protein [Reichenbachiella agariperforans]